MHDYSPIYFVVFVLVLLITAISIGLLTEKIDAYVKKKKERKDK